MTVGDIYCIFTYHVQSMLYGLPQFNPSNKLTESFVLFCFLISCLKFLPAYPMPPVPASPSTTITSETLV